MDKYTYNVKAEKIQKLVKKGDYAAAVKIAETVDWEEVHSVRLLTITAAAYERVRDYKGAIELLQMAYDESAVGKRILYKLTGLAIADRDVELAQNYYEMYLQEAPEENGRYLLRYLLAELKGESLDKRIAILETYRKYEFEEEWALRLAELYDEAGIGDACVKLCDEIILWFGVGEYVDAALKLKSKYAPLSAEQQDKLDNREFYEQRYQEVADEYREKDEAPEEPAEEEDEEGEEEPGSELEQESEPEQEPETEQEEDKPAGGPLLPEPKSDAWRERILFVGADALEKAVPQILSQLNAYHEKTGTGMAVTRIPAVKFNKLGMEASRPHIAEKDLIVDGAAALSEELLREILAYVKEPNTKTVFALTDTPTELAYLDNRLGAIIKEDELPDIDTAASETPELNLDIDAVMDDEPAVDLGGTTKEIVPQVKAALGENDEPVLDERAAVSDTVKFDKGVVAEGAAVAAAAAAAVLPEADEPAVVLPENDGSAVVLLEPAAESTIVLPESADEPADVLPESAIVLPEPAAEPAAVLPEPAIVLPEDDNDYRQETIEDFFKARDEAAEKAEEKLEEEVTAAEEKAEAAGQEVEAVIVAVEGKTDESGAALEEPAEEIRTALEEKLEAAEEKAEEITEAAEEKTEAAAEAAVAGAEEAAEEKAESAVSILEEAKKAVEEKTAAFAEVNAEDAFEQIDEKFEGITFAVNEKAEDIIAAAEDKAEDVIAAAEEKAETLKEAAEEKAEEAAEAAGTAVAAGVAAAAEEAKQEIAAEATEEAEDPKEALRRKALSIPGSMVPENFVTYAKNYLTSIDCVLEEGGEEALVNAAEYRLNEGTALTKEEAENIIEAAADLSEKKGGLFARRYNKEGCLILKTKYIV